MQHAEQQGVRHSYSLSHLCICLPILTSLHSIAGPAAKTTIDLITKCLEGWESRLIYYMAPSGPLDFFITGINVIVIFLSTRHHVNPFITRIIFEAEYWQMECY